MSDTKHTPGELKIGHAGRIEDQDDTPVCEMGVTAKNVMTDAMEWLSCFNHEANAKRIILTWNAHDDLLAACKAAIAKFRVKPNSTLPKAVAEDINRLCQRDPTCQQLVAAVSKAEPKPSITGTPAKDVVRGEQSKDACFAVADPFVTLCAAGVVELSDIDSFIDAWRDGKNPRQAQYLGDFLGMTAAEYAKWSRDSTTLDSIIETHKEGGAE